MTSSELKSLVKEYFNLTEVKFGEIFDENRAFKVVFEGETLELGMPVTVRLRGKFAFQISGIENPLAGLMQAKSAKINNEIYLS